MGYLGAPVAEEYGGRSLDYISYGLVVEEIGRGDSSARTVVSVQTSLVAGSIEQWGTEEQKQEILPKLCSGEWLGCFGLTEPGTGSDAASVATRATTQERRLVDLGLEDVHLARQQREGRDDLRPDRPREEAPRRGLLPRARPTGPGFTHAGDPRQARAARIRHRRAGAGRVEVSDDEMLGEVGDGFKIAMSALDRGRYSVAAGCVGIAQGCVNESVKYSKERRQFDRPIASFQLVQELIAEMVVDTDAARLLVWRAGHLKDQKQPNTLETSIAKYYATEAAVRCANNAIQVHGGYGYIDEYPVERYMRDARVTTLYEGTSQIQKLIIGRHATGINALIPE